MKDFESNEGFFDLCVNVPDGGADYLNGILLKLYESESIARVKSKVWWVNRYFFIILQIYLVISGLQNSGVKSNCKREYHG